MTDKPEAVEVYLTRRGEVAVWCAFAVLTAVSVLMVLLPMFLVVALAFVQSGGAS